MKKLLLLTLSSFQLSHTSGFDAETTVMTSSGRLKPIKELKIGEEVICYNKDLQQEISQIKTIHAYTADTSMQITTQENIALSCSTMERFFLPKEAQWVCAKDLKIGDCLLNENLEAIAITDIQQQNTPKEMIIISVDQHHNFLASKGNYIVHNGGIGWHIGFWVGKSAVYLVGHGTIAIIAGGIGIFNVPAGTVVGQALESTFAGPIEAASNIVGLGIGLSTAASTGPV